MTSERFAQLIVSDAVVNRIKEYRKKLPELDDLKQKAKAVEVLIEATPDPKASMNDELKGQLRALRKQMATISSVKTGLPVLMYQCSTFDETTSKKGYKGRWRKQQAARLNGLFMLDVDHLKDTQRPTPDPSPLGLWTLATIGTQESEGSSKVSSEGVQDNGEGKSNMQLSPKELYMKWRKEQPKLFSGESLTNNPPSPREGKGVGRILLIHITPSGRGLRIVAKADPAVGNIADNQAHLAELLGVEPDVACKDASRCSFCPGFEDILFINKDKLFTYENNEYDEKFGPLYRGGNSQPTHVRHDGGAQHGQHYTEGSPQSGGVADGGRGEGTAAQDDGLAGKLKEGYHGKAFKDICEQWFATVQGGKPKAGDRHQSLYRMACDLRYITDFDPKLLARVLEECEVGRDIASERGSDELQRIASDACALQRWRSIPQRFAAVLQAAGVQLDGSDDDAKAKKVPAVDYGYWWHRLEPLLSPGDGMSEAVAPLPDEHKLAGVLAAGAMYGTYLTRCWWEHFDGKDYRLSFLVYIIGGAASGKSFVPAMDALIMAPMLASDRVGREWERQYKEEMKKRSASSKNAKAEAPDQQHPVIRYVPSTISNAMLYRRLTDAIDRNTMGPDGQPMHLHCYTCEAELATALRAQQGSWAGKLDLECKSFQNEVAGVDYANDQSTNGIIQVNWNQVVTGTPDAMSRKIRPGTVLDGLVTRLIIFPMPQNDFAMIERRRAVRDHDRECMLRSIGIWLEEVKGELKAERLVDFCYDYEAKLAQEARLEDDHCLDYFRKRIPLIMMRYGLVRLVLRQKERALKGEPLEVTDDDLEFCRLIGDFCLMAQMHLFGQQVMEAMERESQAFVPRKRSRKVREAYAMLPEELTTEILVKEGVSSNLACANVLLRRWINDGLVKKINNTYRKLYKEIPL